MKQNNNPALYPLPDELNLIIQRSRLVPSERILRMPALRDKVGRAPPTIWKDISDGLFPPPVKIGARAVGWKESEVNAWIDACSFASRCKNRSFDMRDFITHLTDAKAGGFWHSGLCRDPPA